MVGFPSTEGQDLWIPISVCQLGLQLTELQQAEGQHAAEDQPQQVKTRLPSALPAAWGEGLRIIVSEWVSIRLDPGVEYCKVRLARTDRQTDRFSKITPGRK